MNQSQARSLFALGAAAYATIWLTVVVAIPPGIKLYQLLERIW